ncbi:MAG TPA: hypothetical protein PKV88_04505, partial [Bacteroidales bacterium]|nr:hypothetical protein [Bacteroidales bacterium]
NGNLNYINVLVVFQQTRSRSRCPSRGAVNPILKQRIKEQFSPKTFQLYFNFLAKAIQAQ